MFISTAHASEEMANVAPGMADTFWTNMGLIGVMFVLFYLLMIRPQQKRMQQQRTMLDGLEKGNKVVTGGGLVGVISKVISDDEVEIDLGSVKVTAMRYTLQKKSDNAEVSAPVNDAKPNADDVAEKPKKKVAAKKTSTAKKAAPKATKAKTTAKKTVAKKTTSKKKA